MQVDVQQVKDKVSEQLELIHRLRGELSKAIVGQEEMLSRLLIGVLTNGHILLEGVPGLAKTTGRQFVGAIPFNQLSTNPVHARPAPGRSDRDDDLRPPATDRSRLEKDRFSRTSCWLMRSIGLRPRCSPRCWKPCRSGK